MKGFGAAEENIFRELPSVDELLRSATGQRLTEEVGSGRLANLARSVLDSMRSEIERTRMAGMSRESASALAEKLIEQAWAAESCSGIRRVINATGVIIHTNLGRAPLSKKARRAIAEEAAGYCTLEYDIETGKRGRRGARVEKLLAELTATQDALVVNNCAAAAFLVLKTFASGGEVIVSRGELVEIGGDFRIPEVLVESGACLIEVGTTNRTKVSDYERAIGENTRMILKVHPSNYRIVGFTESPGISELAELAHRHDLLLYEDAGSGALVDLSAIGLSDEPVIGVSLQDGVDIITFSGDKLLGGPQAGVIAGRKALIERLRKHSLYRALRVDKTVYAGLEATLESYARERGQNEIPVLQMLSMSGADIEKRARAFVKKLELIPHIQCEIVAGNSAVGGGAAPMTQPETTLIALKPADLNVQEFERALRHSTPPVIARIVDDKLVLDLRTVSLTEETMLEVILERIVARC